MSKESLAIIGAGNLGTAIAEGLADAGLYEPERIVLTRRHTDGLDAFAERGFLVTRDNLEALAIADHVILAVEPQQLDGVLEALAPAIDGQRHTVISVVSGADLASIADKLGPVKGLVRAMPNTAIAIRESMTTLAADRGNPDALALAQSIFETVGRVLVIDEAQMEAATALGACGVAFFLRAVRAASQGGVEIGFHFSEALAIAAQTARGAASLVLAEGSHPEAEIDRVTTPRGCTISGLNRMEHEGFSSAMIKGIITSARKAGGLYDPD